MDLHEAIRTRRSVRSYEDRPVAHELLAKVIEEAVWAPSGVNMQPWTFVIVEGREALAACSAAAKAQLAAEALRRPDLGPLRGMLEAPDFNMFYDAPALVVICATTPDEMAMKDCCLAAQTLMLAARGAGLGTCWIGFAEQWLASPDGMRRLGIPVGARPVAPIIIGYPRGEAHAPERRPPEIRYAG